ncbi:MAG TPA: potassium channel family protein [Candidatus Binatia bacterium]|nr:potassium channel family protein [Candidatus Binatia bacterium]
MSRTQWKRSKKPALDNDENINDAMITRLLIAGCLVGMTVTIHAAGLALVLERVWRSPARLETRFWPITWLLIRIAWFLIFIHLFEIAVWALFFWWQKCLPDAESSFYFSGVTYATLGYGDLLLPKGWRLFGPVEALTGTLMCGLSIAFFFAVLSKQILQRMGGKEPSQPV